MAKWQVLRVEHGYNGCIHAVHILNGHYDSAEEAELSVPDRYATYDGIAYFVAKRVSGDSVLEGSIIDYNG